MEEVIVVSESDLDHISPSLEKVIWSPAMVIALVEEYKKLEHQFNDPSNKRKVLWKKIAKRMNDDGFVTVNEVTCDIKWRNLKKTFKDIKSGNRSSTKWMYYDILVDVFGKEFDSPENIHIDSGENLPCTSSTKKRKAEIMELVEDEDVNYDTDCVKQVTECPKCNSDCDQSEKPPQWFTDFLIRYQKDEENRAKLLQKMHSDIIAIEEKKCGLLSRIIEQLNVTQNHKTNSNNIPDHPHKNPLLDHTEKKIEILLNDECHAEHDNVINDECNVQHEYTINSESDDNNDSINDGDHVDHGTVCHTFL